MPTPEPGEKRADFVQRCVAVVSREEPESKMKYRLAKCYGIFAEYQKTRGKSEKVQPRRA